MKTLFVKYFDLIFVVLAIAELSAVLWIPEARFITKPAILVALIFFYIASVDKVHWIFLVALVFALLGDVLLMFDGLFVFGLGSFLLMQLLYVICFYAQRGKKTTPKLLLSLLVIVLTVFSVLYLYPHSGDLVIPVIVYSAVILMMVLSGIWRKTNGADYQWILWGVMSFLVSDGILAINKFANPFESAGFLVMLTYIIAQYLIVKGYLKHQGQTM